jgi:hypothetical protein
MNCEYVREYYNVPAQVNMRITYKGEGGIIWKDGGNYIAACMDKDKPGQTIRIHPTDPDIEYGEIGTPRPMTRSQRRYREYLDSVYYEAGDSFAYFLGIE